MILLPGLRLMVSAIYGVDLNEAAPEEAIPRIAPRPVLLIHGTEDPDIPHDHAERLKAAAGPSAALWSPSGAEHTQGIWLVPDCETAAPTRDAYLRRSVAFFRRRLGTNDALIPGEAAGTAPNKRFAPTALDRRE